ncbi:MAG TPA: lysophospholipid acyltransferase family protein [Myxococcota bacterium]|nr:lysophospholipid acyltransferase family protein [Myxococcota bacterium]
MSPERDRRAHGRIPPEALAELRASVRALRDELEQRFGVRDSGPTGDEPGESVELEPPAPEPDERSLGPPPARASLFEQLRTGVRARLEEIDVVKLYESLRERIAIPGAGDISAEVDDFGLDLRYLARARRWLDWLYDSWWRVELAGHEGIPDAPRVLFVANSAGILPWDALMIAHAIERTHPGHGRPRALVADWIATLPFSHSRLARLGAVRACAENAERLLAQNHWVIAFPEGQKGALKPFRERYRLQRFARGGFVSLAVRLRAALVPVAVIGSEEVHPILFEPRILRRLLGIPVPVTPTFPWLGPLGVVPLPSRWRIRFGEPIWFDTVPMERAGDPLYVNRTREQVRGAIQNLLEEELPRRRSVFA